MKYLHGEMLNKNYYQYQFKLNIMNKKVVSREFAKEWKGKDGGTMYNFKVKFEGDDKTYAYTSDRKDDPPYFKPGEEAEFTVEEKSYEKDGATTTYYNVKPVKKPFVGGKGYVPKEKSKKEVLCEHLAYTSRYVVDMIVAGKVKDVDWQVQLDRMMDHIEQKIEKYFSE